MFSTPINEIDYAKVAAFCSQGLPEGQRLEYKKDFPSDLPKTVSAFANTLGGIILIGVDEDRETKRPIMPIQGIELSADLSERVTASCLQGIYPPIFPDIKVCELPEDGSDRRAVVVVRVHESDQAPHWIGNRDRVYLRAENISQPYKLANYQEMAWLWDRRARSIEFKRRLGIQSGERLEHAIRLADARLRNEAKFSERARRIAVATPTFPRSPLTSVERLMELARASVFSTRQGLTFPDIISEIRYVADGVMMLSPCPFECIQLSQFGYFTYMESQNRVEVARKGLATTAVAFWFATSLKYALNLYRYLGYFGLVDYTFGLEGIMDSDLFRPDFPSVHSQRYSCYDRQIYAHRTLSLEALEASYAQVFKDMLSELLRPFDYKLSPQEAARLLDNYGPRTR